MANYEPVQPSAPNCGPRPDAFSADEKFHAACAEFRKVASECNWLLKRGRDFKGVDEKSWAYRHDRWSEILRPKLDQALAKIRELGSVTPDLNDFQALYDNLIREFELVCKHRNGEMKPLEPERKNPGGKPLTVAKQIYIEIIRIANTPDGLPRRDDLSPLLREKFPEAGDSTLRGLLAEIYGALKLD
jgi:hypothetical protein